MKYNKDQATRDKYISKHQDGEYPIEGNLDFYRFGYISLKDLKWLVENGFADPKESQNNGPTIEQFIAWGEYDRDIRFSGYAVGGTRDDYRITIDGFETNINKDTVKLVLFDPAHITPPDAEDEGETVFDKYQAWWD